MLNDYWMYSCHFVHQLPSLSATCLSPLNIIVTSIIVINFITINLVIFNIVYIFYVLNIQKLCVYHISIQNSFIEIGTKSKTWIDLWFSSISLSFGQVNAPSIFPGYYIILLRNSFKTHLWVFCFYYCCLSKLFHILVNVSWTQGLFLYPPFSQNKVMIKIFLFQI